MVDPYPSFPRVHVRAPGIAPVPSDESDRAERNPFAESERDPGLELDREALEARLLRHERFMEECPDFPAHMAKELGRNLCRELDGIEKCTDGDDQAGHEASSAESSI